MSDRRPVFDALYRRLLAHPMVRMKAESRLSLFSCGPRILKVVEVAKDNPAPVDLNVCAPSAHVLGKTNSGGPAGVVLTEGQILLILRVRHVPQISPTIVSAIAVDVVDLDRLFASHQLPNHPLSVKSHSTDDPRAVSACSEIGERRLPSKSRVPYFAHRLSGSTSFHKERGVPSLPDQFPRRRVVFQKLAKVFGVRQGLFSHGALHLRSWSGPRGVQPPMRPAPSIIFREKGNRFG